MRLDLDTFLGTLEEKIKGCPDEQKLASLFRPFAKDLRQAEASGQDDEVRAILTLMNDTLGSIMNEMMIPADDAAIINPPIKPYPSFTNRDLIKTNLRKWTNAEYSKRRNTFMYFGFDKLEFIYSYRYDMPTSTDIFAGFTADKLLIIEALQKPLMIITPIGVGLNNLTETFISKKGAMESNIDPINYWNIQGTKSDYFDRDIDGDMIYHPQRFDKDNHGGQTKRVLLTDRASKFKGWQVLVVEGADDLVYQNISANDTLLADQRQGFTGLTPEDDLMMQAEGLRMGKPFESGVDFKWLTGAYLPKYDMVPLSAWNPWAARVEFNSKQPDHLSPRLGSRRAVRIL